MKNFIFYIQCFANVSNSNALEGDSTSGATVDGGTKNGTEGDDNLSTTDYDDATGETTIYTGLNGLPGNDNLNNYSAIESVTMDGGTCNDYIYNYGANSSLIGGEGNDYISNRNSMKKLIT